jgi:DNA-binding transcriptional MerR regulator
MPGGLAPEGATNSLRTMSHSERIAHKPRFNARHLRQVFPGVTYRQINHWESKGLLTAARDTDSSGWRKFSLVDVVCLAIITELRSFGRDLPSIAASLRQLQMSQQAKDEDTLRSALKTSLRQRQSNNMCSLERMMSRTRNV